MTIDDSQAQRRTIQVDLDGGRDRAGQFRRPPERRDAGGQRAAPARKAATV